MDTVLDCSKSHLALLQLRLSQADRHGLAVDFGGAGVTVGCQWGVAPGGGLGFGGDGGLVGGDGVAEFGTVGV